jgi:c-di-GMP-binding flagellar brake protein YcgR
VICEICKKYANEKRKSPRIPRPLRLFVTNAAGKTPLKGRTINVSQDGALIQDEDCHKFNDGERMRVGLYLSDKVSDQSSRDILDLSGVIKSVKSEERKLAVMFLKRSV